jgi:hypothetical protein
MDLSDIFGFFSRYLLDVLIQIKVYMELLRENRIILLGQNPEQSGDFPRLGGKEMAAG